jgi:predicted dehydrogenase
MGSRGSNVQKKTAASLERQNTSGGLISQSMNSIRIGVVGIGNIGTAHVRNLLSGKISGVTLTAICDRNPAALARFPQAKHYADSAEMIRSGDIDALLIAVPHFGHVPIGIEALQNGLHVLCEKPLAVHVADGRRLLAAHTDPKLIFGVMFDTRTEPRFIRLRELVQSGELGKITRIHWTLTKWFRSDAYYRSSNWRATWAGEGGGMLVNQLPHDLDLFQWIFGLPKKVRAFCGIGKFHDIEVEDEINAYFEMPDGATALITANTGEAPGTDLREVVGDRGRAILHADHLEFTRNEIPASEFCRTTTESFSTPPAWEIRIPTPGTAARHAGVLQVFVNAISTGTALIARAEEGLASAELANAILYSSYMDRTIELPLDAAAYEAFLAGKIKTSRFVDTDFSSIASDEQMASSFNH